MDSQIDRILTERLDNEMSQSEVGEEKIQKYLEDERLLSENEKLKMYKEICKCYNEGLKEIEFEPEERDDNNALQNIGEDRNDFDLQRLSSKTIVEN